MEKRDEELTEWLDWSEKMYHEIHGRILRAHGIGIREGFVSFLRDAEAAIDEFAERLSDGDDVL